jgi:hypothetical protein
MRGRKMIKEGSSPTLWPLNDDEIRAKLAIECLEEENRRLKDIVVCLSATILRNLVDLKSRGSEKTSG